MILATLGTSMVEVLVVTRCHAQYGAVHNHRDLCDTPLDETINRLTQIKAKMGNDPRSLQAAPIIESCFVSRIKTLQEVLGIGSWDEKELSGTYKLDPRRWQ
jgi:hypothetical protein